MANISLNNVSVLMIISTLIIIFILVTFFVISENNFNDNLEQGAASANNNGPNNVNANNNANETAEEESEVDYSGYNNVESRYSMYLKTIILMKKRAHSVRHMVVI